VNIQVPPGIIRAGWCAFFGSRGHGEWDSATGSGGGRRSSLSEHRRPWAHRWPAGLFGNFPQAFSHLSLISAAVNLDRQLDHGAS